MTQLGLTVVLIAALLLSIPSCGKKGDPFLPRKDFDARVTDLKAEQQESSILLEGSVVLSEIASNRVKGSRVYFAEYPAESPPCEGCPIEYQGYRSFGPEVIQDGRSFPVGLGCQRNEVYFFRVVLVGPGESTVPLRPSSE